MNPTPDLESFSSEWMLDSSWTAPVPADNTLAALIQDLTQAESQPIAPIQEPLPAPPPATEQVFSLEDFALAFEGNAGDAIAAQSPEPDFPQPQLTLADLFAFDAENDAGNDAETLPVEQEAAIEPAIDLLGLPETIDPESEIPPIQPIQIPTIEIFDLPGTLDPNANIPPIQPIQIQPLDLENASDPHFILSHLFEGTPITPAEPEPADSEWIVESNPAIEREIELPEPAIESATESAIELPTEPAEPEPVEPGSVALLPNASNLPLVPSSAEVAPAEAASEIISEVLPEPVSPVSIETPTDANLGLDAALLDQLDQLLAAPPDAVSGNADTQSSGWFLGVDIGTTGISAVLLHPEQCQLYPLYWQSTDADTETAFAPRKQFRLSTAVTLATANPTASALPTIRLEPTPSATPRLSLSDWKPYLKVAVPHHSPQTSQWEPVLQWSSTQTLPLRTLQEALQQLLATIHPERSSFMPTLTCAALGLETALTAVLRNLAGIVVGHPGSWSETYSFNVREAMLQAELVTHPDQIIFVEEAVAALLSALPAADGRSVSLAHQQGQSGHLHNADWQGVTLILTAGASLTELVLVNLPQQLAQLNPTDFYVRSLPYAGQGIDQDVLSQLLYPALLNLDLTADSPETLPNSDFVLDLFDLNEVGLTTLEMPNAAELAPSKRHHFQQFLLNSPVGQQLLTAARTLKITLQHQPRFTVQFGSQEFTIERQDLTSQVLLPYIQRLNRELNTLLAQTNTTAAAVNQVICTGGTASLSAIARWLRQKLPNAMIVQDTYPRPASPQQNHIPSCSRIAYGLATVPLHPQVIDRARHQYSDFFLLLELLRTVPAEPVRVETIMERLEQRGIDTQTCRFRILALLDGHLPPGLVPADVDLALLTPESVSNPDYQAIQFAPVFTKQADRTYQINQPQRAYLQQYLETLLTDTEQTLTQSLQLILIPTANS